MYTFIRKKITFNRSMTSTTYIYIYVRYSSFLERSVFMFSLYLLFQMVVYYFTFFCTLFNYCLIIFGFVWERHREKQREKQRDTERDRESQTERERQRETHIERQRQREIEKKTERDRELLRTKKYKYTGIIRTYQKWNKIKLYL